MYGVDLYRRVRLACHREKLSQREAARRFGIDRKTVAKMLAFSVPPGYPARIPFIVDADSGPLPGKAEVRAEKDRSRG